MTARSVEVYGKTAMTNAKTTCAWSVFNGFHQSKHTYAHTLCAAV